MIGRVLDRLFGTARQASPDARILRRVRWRLVALSGGATLVVLVLLGIAIYAAVAGSLASSGRRQLEVRAATIGHFLEEGRPAFGERPPIDFAFGGAVSGTFAYVVTPADRVFGPQEFSAGSLPDASGVRAARAGQADVRKITVADVPLRVLSTPVSTNGGVYVVQVIQDASAEQRTLDTLIAVLVFGGLLGVLGAIVMGALYADRALVPIRDALRRQREFAADASHELRTPLSVIRSAVDYVERHPDKRVADLGEVVTDVRDEVEHMTALVSDLLLLARTDSGTIDIDRVPVDLAETATEALAPVSTLAAARHVGLTLDPAAASVVGDPVRLRQLVTILADNALSHSPEGGAVTVRVRSVGRTASLVVEDQGPGIRPEDLPRVFDRFWRASDAPGGGTGLGLAIAAWIVEQHGGTIEAANRDGGGAAFTVRIPLDRSQAVALPASEPGAERPDA